jgi:hypothetical protein
VQGKPAAYRREDNLAFGSAPWNSDPMPRSFARWAAGLPGVRFGATLEVPYGLSHGVVLDANRARALGADVMQALCIYLSE